MKLIRGRPPLAVHAVTVLVITVGYGVLYALVMKAPGAGPTSGVAMAPGFLALAVAGFPWACAFWINPYAFDGLGEFGHHAIMVGPAWLNLAIHSVVYMVRTSRAASQSEAPADPT